MFSKSGCKLHHSPSGRSEAYEVLTRDFSVTKRAMLFFFSHTTDEFGEKIFSHKKKLKQMLSTILGLISVCCIKVPARFQIPVNL